MNINILFFSHFFSPQNIVGATRSSKIIKYIDPNLKVTVITTTSNYHKLIENTSKNVQIFRYPIRSSNELKANYKNKKITTVSFLKFFVRDLLFFPDKFCWWYLTKLPTFLKIIKNKKINVLYASADPFSTALTVYILNKITNIPYIIDYRDPWTNNKSCNYQTFIRKFMTPFFESLFVKNASGIISTTKQIENNIMHIKSKAKKIVIKNGYDPEDIIVENNINNEKFTFLYTGKFSIHSTDYNPTIIINSFINFNQKFPESILQLMGKTDEYTIDLIKKLDKNNCIHVIPFMPKKDALSYQSKADCFIHFYYPEIHTETISLKIFEYIMNKKPIISVNTLSGETHDLLTDNNFGISVSNDNPKAIVEALTMVYNRQFINSNNYEVMNEYNYRYLSQKVSNFIQGVLNRD